MNKTYRVVWNESTNTWVAVAEIATARGKSGKAKVVAASVAVVGALASPAHADLIWGSGAKAPGEGSMAMGINSDAKTKYTIAVGQDAVNKSNGDSAVLIGHDAQASSDANPNTGTNTMGQQVVIGESSRANSQSVAVGAQVYATGQASIAIGGDDLGNNDSKTSAGKYTGANAWRNYAGQPITVEGVSTKDASNPAIGFTSTTASGRGSIAIGHMSQSTGKASLAFGADSHAEADGAIAAGMASQAKGSAAVAIGVGAEAPEAHATAIGLKAKANGGNAFAAGSNAKADGKNSISLGSEASTETNSATYYRIKNVPDKTENNIAIGTKARSGGLQTIAFGAESVASKSQSVAFGFDAQATGDQSVALGANTRSMGDSSVAIGGDDLDSVASTVYRTTSASADNDAYNDTPLAQQYRALTGQNLVNFTPGNRYIGTSTGQAGVAVGVSAKAADLATAIGTKSHATGDYSVAFGVGANATLANAVALGAGSTTAANATDVPSATIGSITYGSATSPFAGSGKVVPGDQVSVGSAGFERQIKHVAPGAITAASTDAINGSQLFYVAKGLQDQISNNSATRSFGVNADNNSLKTHQLGKELAIVAGNTTEATSTSNLKTNVTQDAATGKTTVTVSMKDAPTFASVTTQDAAGNKTVTNAGGVTITPVSGNPVSLTKDGLNNGGNKITGVADGTIGAGSKEAVNGGQLHDLKENGFKIAADTGTADTVKLTETVKYTGDSNIVTKVTDNQIGFKLANTVTVGDAATGGKPVKIDGTTGNVTGLTNITWDPDTTPITSGRAATEDQLKKVADTANAGFKVAGNDKAAGVTADDETIKAGETLSIKGTGTGAFTDYDGSNIQTQLGQNGEVTIGLKKDLAVNSVTTADAAGNKTVTGPNGITITPAAPGSTPVSLTNNGLNNGGNTIKGVGSALNTYTSGKPQGLVDLSALTPDQKASAATAGDLANMGWVLSSDKTTGNLGTAFSGQVKNANEVEFVGKNGATVSANVDASGKHVVTVDVNAQSIGNNIQQPVVYTQADGSKVYKQPDGTFNTAADGSGTTVQPADVIASMQGADGRTTPTAPAVKDPNTGIMTMNGGTPLTNVASAGDVTDPANAYNAVNAGDLNNSVQNLVNNGFKIDADSGTVDTVKLGETVKYAGDSNIVTKVSNNRIDFALANIVTVGDAATGKPVKIDGTTGTVTGLTNITWDPATTPITSGRAATEDQLLAVANAANSAGAGFTIAGNSKAAGVTTADETIKAGETLSIKGTGTGAFTDYDSSNIQTQVGANGEVTVGLKKDLNVNSVTAGNTKVDNGGITITNPTDPSKNVSLTGNGLNNGGNTITNVGDGVNDTDAVNVRQLKAAQTNVNNLTNNVIGTDKPNITTYDVHGNVADNQNTVVEAINNMNTGGIKFFHVNDGTGTQSTAGTLSHPEDSSAKGNYGAAVGYQAKADGESSVAFGKGAQATGKNTIAIGTGNVVTGEGSGAIGDPTTITGRGTYSVGNNNGTISANEAGVFGNNNTLTGDSSRIIGNSSTVTTTDTFVMGNNSTSNVANSVVLGSNAAATSAATASSAGTTTYASSVINGTTYNYAGATPTGVVSVGNVGAERRVQNVAAGLISADSTDAINGSQLYATNSAINALQTGAAGIVQYSNGNAQPNGGTPTNHVTMVGADQNAPVTVHNVAAGVAPTDAVNVSQLQGVAGQIGKVADEADAGTAAAMAAAGLPQAYLPGKSMVAVSGSTYRGKQGYAVGFSAINDGGNWIVKGIATGNSKGKFGATIGAGYQW